MWMRMVYFRWNIQATWEGYSLWVSQEMWSELLCMIPAKLPHSVLQSCNTSGSKLTFNFSGVLRTGTSKNQANIIRFTTKRGQTVQYQCTLNLAYMKVQLFCYVVIWKLATPTSSCRGCGSLRKDTNQTKNGKRGNVKGQLQVNKRVP